MFVGIVIFCKLGFGLKIDNDYISSIHLYCYLLSYSNWYLFKF